MTTQNWFQRNKETIKTELGRHLSDSTAITCVSLLTKPIIDTQILGIPDDIAINARLCGIATVYGGLGSLTKIRDASKKYFGLDKPERKRYASLHDGLMGASIALGIGPAIYYFNGVKDITTIACATALGIATTAAISIPYGWYVDTFRDLTGIKESDRFMPQTIRQSSPKTKKTLAAITTVGFIAIAAGVYSLPNHNLKATIQDYFKQRVESTQIQNGK